jgi:aspartyl protease family protein
MADAMVNLSGILGDKALLSIAGSPPRVMQVGEVRQGVRLISVQGDQVVVEEHGRRRPISLGFASSAPSAPTANETVLYADGSGHFTATGKVNGTAVGFLVDTGASLVTLPRSVAVRAGVSLDNAAQAGVLTAGGVVTAWHVLLNTVSVGDIALHMVDAVVLDDTKLPVALLGMSFLNRTDMTRTGVMLTLTQRY